MVRFHVVGLALLAGSCLVASAERASAEGASVYQATLAEAVGQTQEISTDAMRRIVADGSAIIIDSRSRAEFDAGHIPQAVPVGGSPAEQTAAIQKIVAGDKTKALVLYCNGPFCQASRRLADALVDAGFQNVRRYQLGLPIWRALGGPTAVELDGVRRVAAGDRLAVFIDARSADQFQKGSLPGAVSAPVEDVVSGKLKKIDLPEDDFNRRIILFGQNSAEARKLADVLSKRPWHNVSYFNGAFAELAAVLKTMSAAPATANAKR